MSNDKGQGSYFEIKVKFGDEVVVIEIKFETLA
jgi:hypothetical protein